MSFIQNLDWRYATKQFDTNKKVSDADLETILTAMHKAPSSLGIQPYKMVVVSNQEIQDKFQAAAWNQPQLGTASAVIVVVANTDLEKVTDEFFTQLSGGDADVRANALAGYENMVTGYIANIPAEKRLQYSSEQAHIALGFGMAAAAELKIDSCAMGGFDAAAYAEILGLPANEVPCVILPIGYRSESENPRPKFRKNKDTVITYVK